MKYLTFMNLTANEREASTGGTCYRQEIIPSLAMLIEFNQSKGHCKKHVKLTAKLERAVAR